MNVTALMRVGRNVSHLESAVDFYEKALGFQPIGPVSEDTLLANILGVERVRLLRMRLGAQEIELSECFPQGRTSPQNARANDPSFQHIAIVTTQIAIACNKVRLLGVEAISSKGPVHLPVSSGDVSAFKFRDPDGHPLEFIQFPAAAKHIAAGFDHSAITVLNMERSVAFYAALGVRLASHQVNHGPEQDSLDGLPAVSVDVAALRPAQPTPHLELLCYRAPKPTAGMPNAPGDISADRLIFKAESGGLSMKRDPDGHVILLDGR